MGYYVLHYTGRRPRGEPEAGGDLGRQRHPVFGGACCCYYSGHARHCRYLATDARHGSAFDPSAQGRIPLHQLLDADDSTAATLWRLGITLPPPRRGRQLRLRKQQSPFAIMASLAVFKRALIAERGQGRHGAPRRRASTWGGRGSQAQEEAAISRDLLAGHSLRSTIRAHGIGSKTVQSIKAELPSRLPLFERGTGAFSRFSSALIRDGSGRPRGSDQRFGRSSPDHRRIRRDLATDLAISVHLGVHVDIGGTDRAWLAAADRIPRDPAPGPRDRALRLR